MIPSNQVCVYTRIYPRTLPKLKCLDTEPVNIKERQQAEAAKAFDYVSNSTKTDHNSASKPSEPATVTIASINILQPM